MRNVLPMCAGLVVVSGIVSALMWHDLQAERQLTADLRTQLAEANIRLRAATLAPQQSVALTEMTVSPGTMPTEVRGDSPVSLRAATAGAEVVQYAMARENELMADPEYRKARLAQQRIEIESSYPGLGEFLGLSEKEGDRLFGMLAEINSTMTAEMNALVGGGQSRNAAAPEIQRKAQAFQLQKEQAVSALLGPTRFSQWQEYMRTRDGRLQAVQMSVQLGRAGLPLSDVQQRAITTALTAVLSRQQQLAPPLAQTATQSDSVTTGQAQASGVSSQLDHNLQLLAAATPHLTTRQIANLRQQFESQAAINLAQQRAERRRANTRE